MVRDCGDRSIYSGIACGAEIVITKETGFVKEQVLKQVQLAEEMGKRHLIVVVAENITDVFDLARSIEGASDYNSRASVLGYIQRGGTPSAFDRILASKMGVHAVELLRDNQSGLAIYTNSLEIGHCPIKEALDVKNETTDLYNYLSKLN